MDGIELARRVHGTAGANGPRCVLMSSTSTTPGEAAEVDRVITKPIRMSSLHDALCELAEGGPAAARSASPSASPPPSDELTPLRVLLVDDSAPNQHVGRHLLASLGIEPNVAANGREAVTMLRADRYDVVLMDLDMPIMNGITATHAIRALGDAVHQPWIVAMTAHAMHGERDRCLAAGMDDYLPKPVDRERLRHALRSAARGAPD
jgi:two-component system, sensor histidine kinase and response regulator